MRYTAPVPPSTPCAESAIFEQLLDFNDADRLREVSGELGRNFATIGRATGVRVSQRGAQVRVSGEEAAVRAAARVLEQLYALCATGTAVTGPDVEQAVRLLAAEPEARLSDYHGDVVLTGARKRAIYPRTPTQKKYVHAFDDHDVVFGLGPAGTGKTYLAMAAAVAALLADRVKRIVLCRPAVEAGEKLGFLPGDLEEKVNPYLRPLYDALHDMVDEERGARLFQKGVIEVAPLAFMRGRTLSNAFIILDEAQNTTPEQMKMFLTRLGNGSKAAVTGDPTQVDLPHHLRSGLVDAVQILEGTERIAMIRFTDSDVVRHPVVGDIVRAYEKAHARRS
ncbi:MAG: PhoH family protein [Myxococcales bacterium]|nr:PhoH family protein [Myxococcales bacterium]